ncbi:MAG TPA: thiamine pyrophosphate-dependent enzyme [Opitutaceae bacterium]|nr:thiamine pyrophosphate-dependent enzyme [Opitutaceae bacterium]HUJ41995.1 thiamine pyrophosphate-dependent enzyme [Opitutaceae bacterium]
MHVSQDPSGRLLLSGNEAVALAALHCGVALGTGYPGTPSTEILESFGALGGRAQWAPNEKVAAEVALGAAFARARVICTMKHVGLNVAADVLFTMTYSGVDGGYVLVVADDPGMASSQNEQDSRRYAEAAAAPLFEPSDSQEAYDLLRTAFAVSERWRLPVLFRLTTRVSHSKSPVQPRVPLGTPLADTGAPPRAFVRDIAGRVMVPGHARPAHRRLRAKLAELQAWNEAQGPNRIERRGRALGIITSGISYHHVREAAPDASVLKLGLSHPLPLKTIRDFAASVKRCVVIEENDPWLATACCAAGVAVEAKDDAIFRFGELNVDRVRRILAREPGPEPAPPRSKPPELCAGCPHRSSFEVLKELDCIVAGDIGCYTLAALPPIAAMDMMIDMGAAVGMGLGLRHVLPRAQAKRVVSVIGDSTFIHGGLPGLVEMAYNPPATGHVLVILDNGTTAMTGQQEHPGTGRQLDGTATYKVSYEDLARAAGVRHVFTVNPVRDKAKFKALLAEALRKDELSVFIARSPCILAAGRILAWEKELKAREAADGEIPGAGPECAGLSES